MPKQTATRRIRRARSARAKRAMTAEDLVKLDFVKEGALDPAGSAYIFPVAKSRPDRKGYDSHLYLARLADGAVRQFTFGKKSDQTPVFSPDGMRIAFVSKRGHTPGIHLLPADGGEARSLVEKDGSFTDLSFSPDGRQILCCFRPNDPQPGAAAKPRSQAGDEPPPKREAPVMREINRLFYRLDGTGFLPQAEAQLWLFDVASGEGRQLTKGKRGARDPVFSPDGRRVAFVSNVRRDSDLDLDLDDLFVVPAAGGRPRRIPTPTGPVAAPSFSPDGKWIAYLGHADVAALWYEHPRVWVVPASGRGAARCLCPRFDQPAHDATISDTAGGSGRMRPHWNPRGTALYFLSCDRGTSGLYRVPARGGRPVQLTPKRINLQGVSVSRDCRVAVGVCATPTQPPEVFAYDLETGAARRLSQLTRAWAAGIHLQRPERVRVRSTEQTQLDAWILKPPSFSPRRRYPAILQIHGGPMTQYGYGFFHEMQFLAGQGYVVFYCNPRGSAGYGRAFQEAIRGDWGNRDFADIMAAADYLAALPYVDAKRIGITGGSYGGYMTNWVLGQTRRFQAAVTQRSVVDLVPFFGSSDIGYLFHHTLGAHPWVDRESYRRQSPLTHAHKIRTPLLIIHSEGDLRCSVEQAENLFATLKVLGRRVEFVRFPEEPHGLSRGGRPDRRLARLEKILEWFRRHL